MKKGDIVFVKPLGYYCDDKIKKAKVVTCGNLYFTLDEVIGNDIVGHTFRNKFSVQEMKDVSKYSPEYKVYLTEKEIQDEIDRPKYIGQIADYLKDMTTDELKNLINKNF